MKRTERKTRIGPVGIGVTQHYAPAPGDYTQECECMARMLGFDFTFITP